MRVTEEHLWLADFESVERLAASLGIVVNERARTAWGNEWRGWLIRQTHDALWRDDMKARAERRRERENRYTVTDRRAR